MAVHECSGHFQDCFTIFAAQAHLTVSCHYGRQPPSPRSTPWGAYRYNHLECCHTCTHSFMVDRSTVAGHVAMVHMCSFMYTNHIDMTAHTPAFLRVGEHSGMVAFLACVGTAPGETRTPITEVSCS